MPKAVSKPAPQKTIDTYIKGFPKEVQVILTKIRTTIRKAAPKAEEGISYQIPTFKFNKTYLIYFAAWKHHIGIYPITANLQKAFKKELTPYAMSKGTVRFPLDKPVPLTLIAKIVKYRIKDSKERGK